jgi:hypothetical protein
MFQLERSRIYVVERRNASWNVPTGADIIMECGLGDEIASFRRVQWNVPSPGWRTVGEDMSNLINMMVCTKDGR